MTSRERGQAMRLSGDNLSISDRASRAQAWEHPHFSGGAEWLAWLGHSEGWGGVQSQWGRGKHRES